MKVKANGDFICGGMVFKPDAEGFVDVPEALLEKDGRTDLLPVKKKQKQAEE